MANDVACDAPCRAELVAIPYKLLADADADLSPFIKKVGMGECSAFLLSPMF